MFAFRQFSRKRKQKDIEPQEVLLDGLAKKKEEEIGVSEKRLETPLSRNILRFLVFFIATLFIVLFGRSFHLQAIEGSDLSSLAERNRSAIFSMQLPRGVVYDRNMNQLVFNSPQFNLYFSSNGSRENIGEVADILGMEREDILSKIEESDSGKVLIEKDLEHVKLVLLEARINNMSGFSISSSLDREYEYGGTLPHVMGYINKVDRETIEDNPQKYSIHDYVGRAGVERSYEDVLSRNKEEVVVERDSSGNIKSKEVVSTPGEENNVVLSLDVNLQQKIEEEVFNTLEEVGSRNASVVAMDPRTGEILSMVSVPCYDNHIFSKKAYKESLSESLFSKEGIFINRAISAGYSPGSVIKPFLAAAALEEGIISPNKKIHSPGYIEIENPWNPSEPTIFRDNQVHGWTDIREAIAVSSNVYFYAIGGGYEDQKGLGIEKIKEYLQLFGMGEATGVDLSSEKSGFIPDMQWKRETYGDPWTVGDTYNTSIGQGYISVTPLQIATAYSAIANGGKLLVPSLMKEIINDEGETVKKHTPQIVRENFISPENLREVKEGMYQTTKIGTARSLGSLSVDVGAKTGTAQISKPGHYHNWITVFAPLDDPEVVITIIIEEVEGVRAATIPLARNVLEWYFKEQNNE